MLSLRAILRAAPHRRCYSDRLFVHQPSARDAAAFAFAPDHAARIPAILAKYPAHYKKAAIIPLLHLAQEQLGYTSLAAMNEVARIVEVPPMRVYEVATFYTMFNREPVGRHLVQVCTTTPCELCGSSAVLDAIRTELGIDVGATTPDNRFTLLEVECAGACVNAPVIAINENYYEDLTPSSVVDLLRRVKNGEHVPPGPYGPHARRGCEPRAGLTSLTEPPTGPGFGVRNDL